MAPTDSSPVEVELVGGGVMYFSYGQFMVFDRDEQLPGSLWNEGHVNQGFVRRKYTVGFGTIFEHGTAELRVFVGTPANFIAYQRVVCVPIEAPSGELRFEGPEEDPIQRFVRLPPGAYNVCVAQRVISEGSLQVGVFVSPALDAPLRSSVVIADEQLKPQATLIETGEVA
jgi:hypothetical protein